MRTHADVAMELARTVEQLAKLRAQKRETARQFTAQIAALEKAALILAAEHRAAPAARRRAA